ncbi:hypothetical protein C4577_07690 [Candidatus Parcubacteria bacterium]|nr:MAG: hypothetical protein C4577_07690 [Candidatus Parcubacteria bacterium]
MLKNLLAKYKKDFIPIFLLFFSLPLFFYKLGQSSLVSWDEAWYAEISRNILQTGNPFILYWNGNPFYDHPPVVYWFMSITFKLFGISDFSARLFPALAGFISLFIIYFLGKELFNRVVGFASSLGLLSSFWFLYRARSGNLDVPLTMFFLLTFLLSFKAIKDKRYLIPFSLSLALLFLTKTMVPFLIIPALVIIFWGNKNIKIKDLKLPVVIFVSLIGGWLISQVMSNPKFFDRYFEIGLPGVAVGSSFTENFALVKTYLHSGIGKWFWPGILAILLGPLFRQRKFYFFIIFFISFFAPFLFSHRGHIWHLIPLHPILVLAFFGFTDEVLRLVFKNKPLPFVNSISFLKVRIFTSIHAFSKLRGTLARNNIIAVFVTLGIGIYFSSIQLRQMWYQFVDISAYISDEAILSKEAGKYPDKFYIDGGDFTPAAVFYSGKNVVKIWEGGLTELFDDVETFVLITHQWRLDKARISNDRYHIIKTDRDKILVLKIKK